MLDQVIETIRRSQTPDTAKTNLMRTFGFTEVQATAILDMQLRRLAALERKRLEDERKELHARIRYLEGLLASEAKRLRVVIEETAALKEKFATPRRTVIMHDEGAAASAGAVTTEADLVMPEGPQVVVLLPDGVQRVAAADYSFRPQRGLTKRAVRDAVLARVEAAPGDQVLLVSRRGLGWRGPVGFVPTEAGAKELGLERGDEVVALAVLTDGQTVVLGTRGGRLKRTRCADLALAERTWGPLIGLAEGDLLLFGAVAPEEAHILLFTAGGQLLRIDAPSVNPQATGSATGVSGISLKPGDRLVGGLVLPLDRRPEAEWSVVVASSNGYLHRTPLTEFPVQGRGSQGVRCLRLSKAGGELAAVAAGTGGPVDVYLADGRRQRLDWSDIPETARDVLGERALEAEPGARVSRIVIL